MTVAELIAWLSDKPLIAKVVIHDANTELFLNVKFGLLNEDADYVTKPPLHAIVLHGDYDDQA